MYQAWYKNIKKQTQNTTSKPKKDGTAKLKCPSQCTKTNHTTEGSLQCFKLQSRYPIPLEAPHAVVKSGFPYTAPSLSTASDLSEQQPNIASMLPSPQTRAQQRSFLLSEKVTFLPLVVTNEHLREILTVYSCSYLK